VSPTQTCFPSVGSQNGEGPDKLWQAGNDPLVGIATEEEVALPTAGPAPIVVATPLMVVTTGVMVTGAPSVGIEIHGARAPSDEAAGDVESVFVAEPDVEPEVTVALDPVAVLDPVDTDPVVVVEAAKEVNPLLPNSRPRKPYKPVCHTQDPRPQSQRTAKTRQEPQLPKQEDDAYQTIETFHQNRTKRDDSRHELSPFYAVATNTSDTSRRCGKEPETV
jgi:hypothetical protein